MAAARPICVLTVGRSGSSVVARALGLLGIVLGDADELLPSGSTNPRGFWERLDVVALNDDILAHFGGHWYAPPTLPDGWEHAADVAPLADRARAIATSLAQTGSRWGFKDPRTVSTLRLWESVAGPFDYVIAVRKPLDVIDSVEHISYPGVAPTSTAQLWLDMNALALEQTQHARRLIVAYEDWYDDPRRVAERLRAFVHPDPQAAPPGAVDEIVAFLDPGLRRSQGANHEAVAGAQEIERFYRLLCERSPARHLGPLWRAHQTRRAKALAAAYRSRPGPS